MRISLSHLQLGAHVSDKAQGIYENGHIEGHIEIERICGWKTDYYILPKE